MTNCNGLQATYKDLWNALCVRDFEKKKVTPITFTCVRDQKSVRIANTLYIAHLYK